MDEIDRLPDDYMKIALDFIMSAFKEYETDAEKNGKHFAAPYFKETVRAYINFFSFTFLSKKILFI